MRQDLWSSGQIKFVLTGQRLELTVDFADILLHSLAGAFSPEADPGIQTSMPMSAHDPAEVCGRRRNGLLGRRTTLLTRGWFFGTENSPDRVFSLSAGWRLRYFLTVPRRLADMQSAEE